MSDHYSFLNGRSVETNLLTSLNDWSRTIENRKCTYVVYNLISQRHLTESRERLVVKMKVVGPHSMVII